MCLERETETDRQTEEQEKEQREHLLLNTESVICVILKRDRIVVQLVAINLCYKSVKM